MGPIDHPETPRAAATTACPVCGAAGRPFVFDQRLLGRHTVAYYRCGGCGLLQTEAPYWLDEAYARPIADTDTGLLQRNLENARFLNMLLHSAFDPDGRFVDVAGGYGVLTRLLRDLGFDAYRSDKYCTNLFADGHEPFDGLRAEALFAFEVLEHVVDPIGFVREQFDRYHCRSLVFSTLTYGGDLPEPGWWYLSPETGQHITFYQRRTLQAVADRLGCQYTRVHDGLHVFSARPLHPALRKALRSKRLRGWLESWYWHRRRRDGRSLTWPDHERAKQRLQDAQHEAPPP